jgi:hypothetical protein
VCEIVGWIFMAQEREAVDGSCEHGYEPQGSIKCGELLV